MKIISGGQTGVDRAALDAAMSLGVECGGWCPEGRLAEDARIPAAYPVMELPGGDYVSRTAQNVKDSDGTVIFCRGALQGGTMATADFCSAEGKPLLVVDAATSETRHAAEMVDGFVREHGIAVLNVAGPRASQWAGGYDFTFQTLQTWLGAGAPTLSFVVPAHNEEHELPASLSAIRAAADASGESYELIVVDDASTDRTAEIAREFGATVVTIDRRQIAAARNAGARAARGEFFFFVDADTRITPGHVRAALGALHEGCVGGGARVVLDARLRFVGRALVAAFCVVYFGLGFGAGAFLFAPRRMFEAVGGFDEQYFAGEELYFSIALKKLGRFKILREPIVTSARKMRMHSSRTIMRKTFGVVLRGKRALRDRKHLSLWYDGKREQRALEESPVEPARFEA
jgi:GT2 family glycosyltransferase